MGRCTHQCWLVLQPNQQERSVLQFRTVEERCALAVSIRVLIDIAEYRDYMGETPMALNTHATKYATLFVPFLSP